MGTFGPGFGAKDVGIAKVKLVEKTDLSKLFQ